MADELIQAGIFEGMTWWNTNPTKNFSGRALSPSPYCSISKGGGGLGSTWPVADHQIFNNMGVLGGTNKSTAPKPSANFFEYPPMVDSSSLQAMGFGTTCWNHPDGIHGGSTVGDYSYGHTNNNGIMNNTTILQDVEWSPNCVVGGKDINCSSSPSTAMNSTGNSSSTEGSTITCDGQIPVASSFPVDSCLFFPCFLHGDFGVRSSSDHEILPPSSNRNGGQVLGSSFAHQRQEQIINDIRVTLLGGSPSSSSPCSPHSQSRKIKNLKGNKNEEGCDSGLVGSRNGDEPSLKRQRIQTPSPLPTFKVRKEKLGDRVTALQQLVSPFGKTDTASVLHEGIEYIKFLHGQVNVLSTPYMKNGASVRHHHQEASHNQKSKNEGEVPRQDLRSHGLCLVPISSTFPVAHETPADFWTPTFGTSFR